MEEKFDRFYQENWSMWVGQVTLLTGSHAAAQECVRGALLRAWRQRPGPDSSFDHDRVLRWAIVRATRRHWAWWFYLWSRVRPLPAALPVEGSAAQLLQALMTLSRLERHVLVLHQVVGWNVEEISERQRLPHRLVRLRLQSARTHLASRVLKEEVSQTFLQERTGASRA